MKTKRESMKEGGERYHPSSRYCFHQSERWSTSCCGASLLLGQLTKEEEANIFHLSLLYFLFLISFRYYYCSSLLSLVLFESGKYLSLVYKVKETCRLHGFSSIVLLSYLSKGYATGWGGRDFARVGGLREVTRHL